ncbi:MULTISPECIES: DMT family transporter [unclassified Pseudoalteromonas]|uniref:DMT family transporter n=1 Tax=unclassified Pseudoalteromonas TaxID=194690 RepID=UPI0010234B97|nr:MULTISPECIES: DMT family transporter [unclassified Pseudoalteromonas]MCO7208334.1 DMT family transporter [Pseudoalteromonas sp. CnMc7-37]RZF83750.1 DMT family transporter [Pseudoalteromonas sp. CO109Y]TMO33494.1 EamA family transporter [Pseudoalteromonas sp. S4491]TMO34181.1 EamA family transporter [Pseudoalteromonas sp. S4488]|tara:strand:+ start:575 stop:1462 length:888 start_codon:yes stop_codon:yes gene_type:complete
MSLPSLLRLFILAAIWGASFLFMRMAANSLGPAVLIELRVGFAAITLFIFALYLRKKLAFATHKKHFFIIGALNSAIPFLLFAYAAQTINASTLSILNSTTPIWGAIVGIIWSKTKPTKSMLLGLLLGLTGVAILVGQNSLTIDSQAITAIVAALCASLSYAIASHYTKHAPKLSAFDNAHGSMWAASIMVLPLIFVIPAREMPTNVVMLGVVALGVLCTAVAYILFFRLIDDIGPTSALTVTFLIPLFGIVWGNLILDEQIGPNTLVGALCVIAGTMLVTGFIRIKPFLKRNTL